MNPLTNLLCVQLWRPDYPALTAQYFLSLDVTLTGNTQTTQVTPKSMNDMYMGVDIWDRRSPGGVVLDATKLSLTTFLRRLWD